MAIQTMYVLEAPAVSGSSLFPISRREKEEGGEGETPEAKGKKGRGGSDKAEKRKEKQSNAGFGFGGDVKGSRRSRRGKEQYFFDGLALNTNSDLLTSPSPCSYKCTQRILGLRKKPQK